MDHYEQVLLRRRQIENGLLELMQTVPYAQINVTRLTGHLGMSRKTFYHYFPGKEACLDSLLSRAVQECALFIAAHTDTAENFYQIYLQNLRYWRQQKPLLDAIAKNNLMLLLLQHCMEHVHREEPRILALLDHPSQNCDRDVVLFYVTGQLALLLRWSQDNFDTPEEEMARKMARLLHSPLISD